MVIYVLSTVSSAEQSFDADAHTGFYLSILGCKNL